MKEEKMVEAEKEPEPEADPGPPVQTALKGPARGGMSVAAGNSRPSLGSANAMSKTARWTAYAGQMQSRISDALRSNPRTRKASARITVRIWVDSTGRIIRATLGGSTGDAALDRAIPDEVLTGLQIAQAPPDDLKMPIVMRVTARRP
jgi:TonB family protein